MKLKQWLWENKQMTYVEYKALPELEQYALRGEHQQFNRAEQIRSNQNWRPMTSEEIRKTEIVLAKEKERYEINLKIGGIDERGNYTALHHRWE